MAPSLVDLCARLGIRDVFVALALVAVVVIVANYRPRARTTVLKGPPSNNFFVGVFKELAGNPSPEILFERWANEYGAVFSLPSGLGQREIVIGDVKGVGHIFARDTFRYWQPGINRVFADNMFGRGILSVEENDHRRVRKALTPAFSNGAIRGYVNVFNNHCAKLQGVWNSILDAGTDTIEVQEWMNKLALENLGITGFSHKFSALEGARPQIIEAIEAFQLPTESTVMSKIFFWMSPVLPILLKFPTESTRAVHAFRYAMKEVADDLLERAKAELQTDSSGEKITDKSIVGLLIKAESASGGLTMTSDEVLAQMNTLFFAGYETTAASLTWALIELCRNPEIQSKLRQSLEEELQGGDPSWEHITHGLPFLDAVTQETLRLHGPLSHLTREAIDNDVIPLGKPVLDASGKLVSELVVGKGTFVNIALHTINISEEIWGPDAHEFKPQRWLGGLSEMAKAVQGHHHLMSFGDGARFCLGRHFALANFKTTLANLVRRYSFEFPGGKDTEVEKCITILSRPKLVGEKGPRVPLRIRRVE